MVPASRIISIGVEVETMGTVVPLLLFSVMEVMLVAKAITRSEGESPILTWSVLLCGAGGGGVVWLLLELLLPQPASDKRASRTKAAVRHLETL